MVTLRNALVALAAAATASAQYSIDPNSVSMSDRRHWCSNQISSCPLICQQTEPGTTLVNTCDAESLTYGCLCGDNKQPNMSEYSLTLPFHVCQQWVIQCRDGCAGNTACQSSCAEDHPCGAQQPTRINTTSTSTMPATATGSSTNGPKVFDGFGDSEADEDSEGSGDGGSNPPGSAAPRALEFGKAYGLIVVAAGLFAGFGVLL